MQGNMNITILPGAATDDVKKIEEIVRKIDDDMQRLDSAIKRLIPTGVETQWSEDLRRNWEHFYSNDVKDSMGEMMESAVNLQRAVDAALEYNK